MKNLVRKRYYGFSYTQPSVSLVDSTQRRKVRKGKSRISLLHYVIRFMKNWIGTVVQNQTEIERSRNRSVLK